METTPVRRGLSRRAADEVVLALAAMGVEAAATVEQDGTSAVTVAPEDEERAHAILAEEDPAAALDAAEAERAASAPVPPGSLWPGRGAWAVALVAAACVAWFVALHHGQDEVSRARLLRFGAITWDQVWLGEWWRLASAVFVHFDGAHLVANLITLALVGPPLAHLLGPWRFLVVFLLAGVAGNVASHLFAASASLKGGASGGIAGVLGALAGTSLDPGWGRRFKRWQVLGALAAIYALLVGAGPGRDNAGHLGGLLAGVALGRLLTPRRDLNFRSGAPM